MRYFKNTFIWVIILTCLAGYYFIDLKRDAIIARQNDLATRLLPFEANQVVKVLLKKHDSIIEMERWEEGWKIVKPVSAPAVNEEVEKFLKYVTDSRNDADYIMDPNPTPERLKEFGLDNPELEVTLFVGKELTRHTIIFGARAPTKGVAFAMLQGDPKVYRVLADAKAQADQEVYDFRDKAIVDYDPVMVDQLDITSASGRIRLKLPINGDWRIEEPFKARADITRVMELLTLFKNEEIKEFVEENPKNLVKYGLEAETKKISFSVSGKKDTSNEIVLGKRDKKKRGVYSRLRGKQNVVLLDDKILDYIPRDPFPLMGKEIFFFLPEDVRKIRILYKDIIREFARTPDFEWKQLFPQEAKVDFRPIADFLQKLKNQRIKKFIPPDASQGRSFGLARPVIKVSIWVKDARAEEWLAVGNKTEEGDFYAVSGEGQGVLVLGPEIESEIEKLLKGL